MCSKKLTSRSVVGWSVSAVSGLWLSLCWADFRSLLRLGLHHVRNFDADRQTDGQTEGQNLKDVIKTSLFHTSRASVHLSAHSEILKNLQHDHFIYSVCQ